MTESSYLIAWLVYLLAASGCLIIGWRMTKNIRWFGLQLFWRALFTALLLSPVYLNPEQNWLVPAYLVGSYDWILGKPERAQEAVEVIGFVFLFTFGVGIVDRIIRSRVESNTDTSQAEEA